MTEPTVHIWHFCCKKFGKSVYFFSNLSPYLMNLPDKWITKECPNPWEICFSYSNANPIVGVGYKECKYKGHYMF